MITLRQYSSKDTIPDCDYLLDKTDKFRDIVSILTPKFLGNWVIILLEPKIKFVSEILEDVTLPSWIDILVLLGKSKLNTIVMNYPAYAPKKRTSKEIIDDAVTNMNNLIDEQAKRILKEVYGLNEKELVNTLRQLDNECTSGTITAKQVKGLINFEKKVYASEVINAFLLHDRRRWSMYETLVHDLGLNYAYNALYSYVRKLIHEKSDFLLNRDFKNRILEKVDAPYICYVYQLFANSNNYNQLLAIMLSIDNRCYQSMERIKNVNF